MNVLLGDLLLTRNKGGESENPSPGYYNHSAIISINNWVIESQAVHGVIAVPIWSFFERYPEILVLRNIDTNIALKTANMAPRYLGRQYSNYMSIRPLWLWKNSDSCISLLRRIYNVVTGKDYLWRVPDSLLLEESLVQIALQRDYKNFIPPNDLYKGMTKRWLGVNARLKQI